jgi:hypothetical protein
LAKVADADTEFERLRDADGGAPCGMMHSDIGEGAGKQRLSLERAAYVQVLEARFDIARTNI